MFKPVQGADLDKFDDETRELYSKKTHDPRLSMVLSVIPRPNRHNLPVIVDAENNKYMQELEAQQKNFKYKYLGLYAFFGK